MFSDVRVVLKLLWWPTDDNGEAVFLFEKLGKSKMRKVNSFFLLSVYFCFLDYEVFSGRF
jgi:hypothetical protein